MSVSIKMSQNMLHANEAGSTDRSDVGLRYRELNCTDVLKFLSVVLGLGRWSTRQSAGVGVPPPPVLSLTLPTTNDPMVVWSKGLRDHQLLPIPMVRTGMLSDGRRYAGITIKMRGEMRG